MDIFHAIVYSFEYEPMTLTIYFLIQECSIESIAAKRQQQAGGRRAYDIQLDAFSMRPSVSRSVPYYGPHYQLIDMISHATSSCLSTF
jgi:hypothetical protein